MRIGLRRDTTDIGRVVALAAVVVLASGCAYISKASVASDGTPGNFDSGISAGAGNRSVISDDGRYVVFQSDATNLVANDTNGATDVFRHDNVTGTTVRVSVDSNGDQAGDASQAATTSADGRYIAFSSRAALVPADTNGISDVYRRDMVTGDLVLVSLDANGDLITDTSLQAGSTSISADGQVIAWLPFFAGRVTVRDMSQTGSEALADPGFGLATVALSRDGKHVAAQGFCVYKCGDGNITAWDLTATTYPFAPTAGRLADQSSDGRYLTLFDQTERAERRFDRQTGVSVAISPAGFFSQASTDGRFRLSTTDSPALILEDLLTGATRRIDPPPGPATLGDPAFPFALTPDARYAAFQSRADLLGVHDIPDAPDVFTVDGTVPTPIGMNPGILPRGATHVSAHIYGGFFLPGSTVDPGPGITIESTTFNVDGSLTVVMSIASNADIGDHTIKVKNPGTLSNTPGSCTDCLAVT